MSTNFKKGLLFALITSIVSGFSIFYNKLVIVSGLDSSVFNIVKNTGAAVFLTFFLLADKKINKLRLLNGNNWLKLITIAAIGGSIPFLLYFEGLRTVSAVNADLIHKTMFIFVAGMAMPVLGESLNIWQVAGYLLIAWSNLFIGGFTQFTFNSGELLILAATVLWSVESIIAKKTLSEIDSDLVAWGRMFFGSLILFAFALFQGKLILFTKLNISQILPVGGSILLLTFYVMTWFKALRYAPVNIVTSVLILATPVTNILSAIFISRSLPVIQIENLFFTLIGLLIITRFTSHFIKEKTQIMPRFSR